MTSLRFLFPLLVCVLLGGCAHRERPFVGDRVPFDERLMQFQSLHNRVAIDDLRLFFTKSATIQSPITPRPATVEKYFQVLKGEPYQLVFTKVEVVYSLPRRAATRTDVLVSAPGRFNLRERVTIDWQVEDGYWRISRIDVFRLVASSWLVATKRSQARGLDRTSHSPGRQLYRLCWQRLYGAAISRTLPARGEQDYLYGHVVN